MNINILFKFAIVYFRKHYCATSDDIKKRMYELESDGSLERRIWTRTAPADLYYSRDDKNHKLMRGTKRLLELCSDFKKILLERAEAARAQQVSNMDKTTSKFCF